jgi:hypothetical protein
MDHSQMFKVGFLLRCADEGLSDEETAERVQEAAQFVAVLEKQAVFGTDLMALPKMLKSLGLWGLAAGGLAGGLGGYAVGKATDTESDPEEVKRQELIAAYQQQADRVRRQLARGSYRQTGLRKPQLVA